MLRDVRYEWTVRYRGPEVGGGGVRLTRVTRNYENIKFNRLHTFRYRALLILEQ